MTHAFDIAGLHYPKSILKLLLLGFALASLPLIVALINATLYLDRLTNQGQAAVDQAADSARDSRVLVEQTTTMERLARQYLILGDSALLADYAKLRSGFKRTTSELSLLPLDEAQLQELNRVIDREQDLFEQLGRHPQSKAGRRQLIEGYVELSDLANGVLEQGNLLIDREVQRMRKAAQETQRSLLWQLAGSIPLGALIAALFAFLTAKPIGQLDQAIRRLGGAEFSTSIRVQGPADLEYLGERLEWLRQRLLELEQQKTRFLHHVSHQLKTPLTALREGSELLADGSSGTLNEQQREISAILRQNSVHLQKLIEDLLSYQDAVSSVGRIERKPMDMAEVARQVLEAHKLAIAARRLTLDLHLEPAKLLADADKLRVMLDNLISNAVKYSPELGNISLVVRPEAGKVLIEVGDAGPGIAAEDRDRVFDWFFQGKLGHGGRVKSSGLGLAIAREFVLAHRGSIEVIAQGKPGARFRVSLPANQG